MGSGRKGGDRGGRDGEGGPHGRFLRGHEGARSFLACVSNMFDQVWSRYDIQRVSYMETSQKSFVIILQDMLQQRGLS